MGLAPAFAKRRIGVRWITVVELCGSIETCALIRWQNKGQTRAAVDEELRIVSQSEGVPLDMLQAILNEMGDAAATLAPDHFHVKLRGRASAFKALAERLNRPFAGDPEVLRLRRAAAEEVASGRFLLADAHLASAEVCDLAGSDGTEVPATQKRLSAAEHRAERAAVAMLRASVDGYRQAADHYAEAARIAGPANADTAANYENERGLTLFYLGHDFELDGELLKAADHFRNVIALAERDTEQPRGVIRLLCARAQRNLANALLSLAQRESHTVRMEEAVAALRAALEVFTRELSDGLWVNTQGDLAMALWLLGTRENETGCSEKAIAASHVKEAIAAFRETLEVYSRESSPNMWAIHQLSIGSALYDLNDMEADAARLEEAVAAYGEAEKEATREREPFTWARIQRSRGDALFKLGEQQGGMTRLEEAVLAYREALQEYTRERAPRDWASTEISLCSALLSIADRRQDPALAELSQKQLDAVRKAAVTADDGSLVGNPTEVLEKARTVIERLRATL
jgi:tetratricopeptide (TPR) repeat protein